MSLNLYSARDVARLLDLSVQQVRSYARTALLKPERGPHGEMRFSFQDLVLLRTAKGLMASRIPPRKVRRALRRLEEKLPRGRPLSGVQIRAIGDEIVVHDGGVLWSPESGQAWLNFDVAELARRVAPHTREAMAQVQAAGEELDADDWYALGCDIEAATPDHARDAYRRALEIDPHHVPARVNLARLLQENGRNASAEAHYRLALARSPRDATALFNLGVCLEDQARLDDAVESYRRAIESDPRSPDAYYNLARLCEKLGDVRAAVGYLKAFKELTDGH